jgi:hypothetical protein
VLQYAWQSRLEIVYNRPGNRNMQMLSVADIDGEALCLNRLKFPLAA